MRKLLTVSMIILVTASLTGCGVSGKKLESIDSSVGKQQRTLKETIEQVEHNASGINTTRIAIEELQRRLDALEKRINSSLTTESAEVQEMKENLSFLNDQILRLDKTVRTNRPVPLPRAVSAFKPGGFEVKTSYDEALAEYEARRYESAISGFNEVLKITPASSLADNAQYWIGECYYSLGKNEKALESFAKVFNFPKSNKLPDAHFKVGKTYLNMGKNSEAKEEFKAVVANYPDSQAAKYARSELAKLGE